MPSVWRLQQHHMSHPFTEKKVGCLHIHTVLWAGIEVNFTLKRSLLIFRRRRHRGYTRLITARAISPEQQRIRKHNTLPCNSSLPHTYCTLFSLDCINPGSNNICMGKFLGVCYCACCSFLNELLKQILAS